jgi:hypothetical protein
VEGALPQRESTLSRFDYLGRECTYRCGLSAIGRRICGSKSAADDVAQHAGCVLPRMLADATGLTKGLSAAVSRPQVTHDRGGVLRDVAVAARCRDDNVMSSADIVRPEPQPLGGLHRLRTLGEDLVGLGVVDE